MSAKVAPPTRSEETADIEAVVGFNDAFRAGLTLFARRAKSGLMVFGLLLVVLAYFAATRDAAGWRWLLGGLLLLSLLPVVFLARMTQMDFKTRGGGPLEIRYHICPSGLEAVSGENSGWVAWGDLWDAVETPRSFLLSVSPQEQYVIPKRSFPDQTGVRLLRDLIDRHRARSSKTA